MATHRPTVAAVQARRYPGAERTTATSLDVQDIAESLDVMAAAVLASVVEAVDCLAAVQAVEMVSVNSKNMS